MRTTARLLRKAAEHAFMTGCSAYDAIDWASEEVEQSEEEYARMLDAFKLFRPEPRNKDLAWCCSRLPAHDHDARVLALLFAAELANEGWSAAARLNAALPPNIRELERLLDHPLFKNAGAKVS